MRAIRKVYCRWAAAPLSRMACFCSASEDHMGRPSAVFQSGQRHTGILAYAISKGVNRIEGVVGRILEIRRRERLIRCASRSKWRARRQWRRDHILRDGVPGSSRRTLVPARHSGGAAPSRFALLQPRVSHGISARASRRACRTEMPPVRPADAPEGSECGMAEPGRMG